MTTIDYHSSSRRLLQSSRDYLDHGDTAAASKAFWQAAAESFKAIAQQQTHPQRRHGVMVHNVNPIILSAADHDPEIPSWIAVANALDGYNYESLPPLILRHNLERFDRFVSRLDGILQASTWNDAIIEAFHRMPPGTSLTAEQVARAIAETQLHSDDPATFLQQESIGLLRSAHSAFASGNLQLACRHAASAADRMIKAVAQRQGYPHNDPSLVDRNLHRIAEETADMELFDLYATSQALADDADEEPPSPDILTVELNDITALLTKLSALIQ